MKTSVDKKFKFKSRTKSKRIKKVESHPLKPDMIPKHHAVIKEDPFTELAQTVNLRSSIILNQHHDDSPKLDLSALHCLAVTVQEYARHLNTSIIDKKRALEKQPPLKTVFTPQELASFEAQEVIKKFKRTLQKEDVTHQPYPYKE